jgi:hypothetical protein
MLKLIYNLLIPIPFYKIFIKNGDGKIIKFDDKIDAKN